MSTPIRIYFGMDGLPLGGAPATTFRHLDVPWAGPSTSSRAGGSSVSTLSGCLRSLRARSALDGVSWVQGGLVEIAVGQWLAACNRIRAVVCSLPRASLLMGAGCGLLSRGFAGLRPTRTRSRLTASRA